MTSTPRWTGWSTGRTRSRRSWPAATSAPEPNPARMALFDLSSSWLEGSHCPLAARGYSRDGKKGRLQIEYGLLTDPAGPPGRGPGLPRQHRRPRRAHRHRGRGAGEVRAGQDGHGRRPGDDHLGPHRRADRTGGGLQLDHRAARPGHPQADGRRRTPAAQPLRPAGPRRDHLRRLPRRAAGRLPQPGAGRRPRPHPRRAAGRHRETPGPHHHPRPGREAHRRRADRRRGRQGDRHVQDRQALHRHHHRGQPDRRPQAGPDRRRGHPGRVLRAPHPDPRRRAGRARRGHRVQEPQIRRAGLPAHQIR